STTALARATPEKHRRCRRPRRGILAPSAKGTGAGTAPRHSRTQSRLLSTNLLASSMRHCAGTVTRTARLVLLTLSVRRRAAACRRTSTGAPSASSSSVLLKELLRPLLIGFSCPPAGQQAPPALVMTCAPRSHSITLPP